MSKRAEPLRTSTTMPANVLVSSALAAKKLRLAKSSSAKLALLNSLVKVLICPAILPFMLKKTASSLSSRRKSPTSLVNPSLAFALKFAKLNNLKSEGSPYGSFFDVNLAIKSPVSGRKRGLGKGEGLRGDSYVENDSKSLDRRGFPIVIGVSLGDAVVGNYG